MTEISLNVTLINKSHYLIKSAYLTSLRLFFPIMFCLFEGFSLFEHYIVNFYLQSLEYGPIQFLKIDLMLTKILESVMPSLIVF